MAAKGLNRYCAICFMVWILCLLPSMSCATPLQDGHQIQTSEDVTSPTFHGPSIQSTAHGAFSTDSGTHMVTEPRTCNTTLEKGPKNRSKNEGDRVTLTCDLKNVNNRRVFWAYMSETGIRRYISIDDYISPGRYDKDKYKVEIDNFFQKYKLVIKDLTFPDDSGTYQCMYKCNSTSIQLASAVVTVLPRFDPSPRCQMNLLPSLQSEADGDTFEIICFWTHGYEGNAHFQNGNEEDVQIHLTFPDRIISRIKASNIPNITCQFMFSTSSSLTMKAPCIGNETTGILRVDPFINEVNVNSNATFNCSFFNQSYSHSLSWERHYGANEFLLSQESLIENQIVISIVKVRESNYTSLVECALNVSDNIKISSFGALRIVGMTTTPPDENPTQWTINNISKTTTDSSESRPTTVTLLPEATIIRVPSPQVSVPTSTVSKSVRPITSTRMLSEASSISVISPLTSVATITTDISESTRSTAATHMLSEATTNTVTNPQKSMATTPNIVTPQRSGLPSCKIYSLPILDLGLNYRNRDSELVCSWNHNQAYQAQFYGRNGEVFDKYISFPDHIISRVSSLTAQNISCHVSPDVNTSMTSTPCLKDVPRLIRVDPFIGKVNVGSTASFKCTYNKGRYPSHLLGEVRYVDNKPLVNIDRKEQHPDISVIVRKHEHEGGRYLLVECNIQLPRNNNMSSYGLLSIVEGTTLNLTTPSAESQTNQITGMQSVQTVKSTTNQNIITGTQPYIKETTAKITPSFRDGQTALTTDERSGGTVGFTNQTNYYETKPSFKTTSPKLPTSSPERETSQIVDNTTTKQPNAPSEQPLVVMISISVIVAVVILLLSLTIVYLLRKRKTTSLPRRLSEDGKTNTIELSNIPHILHEESSEWYALSFKDKRVQDMQGQQSNDLKVKHDDESDQIIPILSTSLGIPSLHLLESIDENVYAEPDVSEEPIRQTISRQQCTFTPLLEDEQ